MLSLSGTQHTDVRYGTTSTLHMLCVGNLCVLPTLSVYSRAPTLFRRFGSAGEVAVDLLARLLSFDPARRCCSEVRLVLTFACTPSEKSICVLHC